MKSSHTCLQVVLFEGDIYFDLDFNHFGSISAFCKQKVSFWAGDVLLQVINQVWS